MEIYLIRHTTPKIAKGICYGQTDIALDETLFEKELLAIRQKLPENIKQVYSSPLVRCQQLAKQLAENPIMDEKLMELNFGYWENKPWAEINKEELDAWMQDFVHSKAGKGESYLDLYRRTLDFVQMISSEKREKIALVTHAGNIRSLVAFVLGLPLENSFRLQLNYGSVLKITWGTSIEHHQLHLIP